MFCVVIAELIRVFTPTTKEMAAIIVIPAIVNNQDIKELGGEIPKLAREWLEEFRPKNQTNTITK